MCSTTAVLRILWICGSRIVGGAERVGLLVAGGNAAAGHDVAVLCPPRGEFVTAAAGAGLATLTGPVGRSLDLRAVPCIRRTLAAWSPQVVVVTTSADWVWASLARPDRYGARLVLVRQMARALPDRVRRLASRHADALVAPGCAVRDSLTAGGIIPPERIQVIPNPVRFPPREVPAGPADQLRAREHLGLDPDVDWIGFFGGFRREKGITDAISAVRQLAGGGRRPGLFICGCSGSGGHASQWAQALGADRPFCHLGYLAEDRLPIAFTAAAAVLVPTHNDLKEGYSLTLLEAMAAGTPVIAYDTGGNADVIGRQGDAGLLSPADDPAGLAERLDRILRTPHLADRLRRGGLARARRHYPPDRAAGQYLRLYQGLLP